MRSDAARVAAGILDSAQYFRSRLPEAFAGYERSLTFPEQYLTACSPQASSAGAPLLFLRTPLGLEPQSTDLVVNLLLPPASTTSNCSTRPSVPCWNRACGTVVVWD